jgi:hypothetical protein
MPTDELFSGFTDEPRERDTPVLQKPSYGLPEVGSGKEQERWHQRSRVCEHCQQEIVTAHTERGETLEVCVRIKAWHIRLDDKKASFLASQSGAYPEHRCPKKGEHHASTL